MAFKHCTFLYFVLLVLVVLVSSCDTPVSQTEESAKHLLDIPSYGSAPLPQSSDKSLLTTSTQSTSAVFPPLYKMLKQYADAHPKNPYVAVAGVWNADQERYDYRSIPLHFREKHDKKKKIRFTYYQYGMQGTDGKTYRNLVGLIPAGKQARRSMNRWLRVKDRSKVKGHYAKSLSPNEHRSVPPFGVPAPVQTGSESEDNYEYLENHCLKSMFPGGHVYYKCEGEIVVTPKQNESLDDDDDSNSGGGPSWPADDGCQQIGCLAGGGVNGISESLADDFVTNIDTTNLACDGSYDGSPKEQRTKKAWCASSSPTGEQLQKTDAALDNIAQRGNDCAAIAQAGKQQIQNHGLRYYPDGTVSDGGWGGQSFGVLLSTRWLGDNYHATVEEVDGTLVKINLEFGLVHEIEHAMGRYHIDGSDWRTPNAVKCSGL